MILICKCNEVTEKSTTFGIKSPRVSLPYTLVYPSYAEGVYTLDMNSIRRSVNERIPIF